MLQKVFELLDQAVVKMNRENDTDGLSRIPRFYIKVLGQTALLEANLGIPLLMTSDVDAYSDFVWIVRQHFCQLLREEGYHFDELSNDIWMPKETQYRQVFFGQCFDGFIAAPEYVLLSKAKMAPQKNKNLIVEYLSSGPSVLFLDLANTYQINLESFLK
ncbi:MAG: hypothetical protein KBD78_10110 [Oligoflexales bacterium]|nr:hypothetical protein [Oligoflexales bacterium]